MHEIDRTKLNFLSFDFSRETFVEYPLFYAHTFIFGGDKNKITKS